MTAVLTSKLAVEIVQADGPEVVGRINQFTSSTFRTRGGRVGSGMGILLEALWVYYMNSALQNDGGVARACELAWLPDHEPADFACLHRGMEWLPESRAGELFRIEAKSMNVGVEEAKGHFTNLEKGTSEFDQMLVLIWSWVKLENYYVWPRLHDYFLCPSLPIIRLRDALHLARGGSFVDGTHCPDGCSPQTCTHHGEPLNAAGKRERKNGPASRKPANVDYAANFGGLLRMIKTDNDAARKVLREIRKDDPIAHKFISFIHAHYLAEEANQYRKAEWIALARTLGIGVTATPNVPSLIAQMRQSHPHYQDTLRDLFAPNVRVGSLF
jgi:hypothetical protein